MSTTPTFVTSKDIPAPSQPHTDSTSSEAVLNSGAFCCVVSTSSEEGVLLSSMITNYVTSQIASASTTSLGTPSAKARVVTFLSLETVDLEIQIQEFLSELNEQKTHTQVTESKQYHHPLFPTRSATVYTPKQETPPSSHAPLLNPKQTKQPSTPRASTPTSYGSPRSSSLETKSLRNPSHVSKSSLPVESKGKITASSLPSAYQGEQERSSTSLLTTKTSEQRHSKHDKDQQQQQSQQDDTPQHKEEKEPTEKKSMSVSALQYQSYMYTQHQPSQEERSAIFQKKAQSPMAMFTSSKSVLPVEESPDIENIFIRFMRLMARILGQAEAEAHELYKKIKQRTDDVDSLTSLLSHINSEPGAINWTNNAPMKELVDHAKSLGVSIKSTYQWSEDEKKLLRENIQMQKENMEKITQLERTDMQRLLQEVSQCHQTRSNILKLLKELMDTFIYNLRP